MLMPENPLEMVRLKTGAASE